MCGFIIYPGKVSVRVLERHLERQKHRGEDGYGALSLRSAGPRVNRCSRNLLKKAFLGGYKYVPKSGVIIHHRKASIGGVKAELVHPVSDFQHTCMVMQNGTKRVLAEITGEDSDTKAIAEIWQNVNDPLLWTLLQKTGVVFVWDQGRLFFHKDASRTLYKCVDGVAAGMYASEPLEAGVWALVDEYILEELPLNVTHWRLEHGEPIEYFEKECSKTYCNSTYAGIEESTICPDCALMAARYATRTPATTTTTHGGAA